MEEKKVTTKICLKLKALALVKALTEQKKRTFNQNYHKVIIQLTLQCQEKLDETDYSNSYLR